MSSISDIVLQLRRELWCDDNPFDHSDINFVDKGYPHTHLRPELVRFILGTVRPRLWVEIGSMLGGSLICSVNEARALDSNVAFIAIDPFCGDVNMWDWEKGLSEGGKWRFLRLENGRPTIYDRFLANVKDAGVSDSVVPIIATSLVGVKLIERMIKHNRLCEQPQVIYLDSAHEADETFLELKTAWRLLQPGGVLFGDDWAWAAVCQDVTRFAQTVKLDDSARNRAHDAFSGSTNETNVFLWQGHWALFKPRN